MTPRDIRLPYARTDAHSSAVLIRRETLADTDPIRDVTATAFARPETPDQTAPEAILIDELRASEVWVPTLSLVAAGTDGDVYGHVLCTRGHVDSSPALALGPLSVHPYRQRRGIGSALMHAVLGAAEALDEPLVALLGDPGYYARFGFRPGEEYGITPPVAEWRPHFEVRPLARYTSTLRGAFSYPEPFERT